MLVLEQMHTNVWVFGVFLANVPCSKDETLPEG